MLLARLQLEHGEASVVNTGAVGWGVDVVLDGGVAVEVGFAVDELGESVSGETEGNLLGRYIPRLRQREVREVRRGLQAGSAQPCPRNNRETNRRPVVS